MSEKAPQATFSSQLEWQGSEALALQAQGQAAKSRLCRPETQLMSEKAPQATFSSQLERQGGEALALQAQE